MPLPSSQSVAGREPMPTTTRSAGSSVPSRQHHRVDVPLSAHLGDPDTEADVDALVAMQPRHQFADLLAEHRGQRLRLRLDQHDVHPDAAQAGGHLTADETGADDHGVPRGRCVFAQRHAFVERPQHPNALEIGKRRNAPRHQAGRDHQLVVAEHGPVGEGHRLRARCRGRWRPHPAAG